MSRQQFIDAISRRARPGQTAYGSGTSIVCRELMDVVGVAFPEAHLDAEKMATLAIAGHTVLEFDVVMPLFSVCHEAAAMGCNVDWGDEETMPRCRQPIFTGADDIAVPADLLSQPACRVALQAISLLRHRLGDAAAVCGKVFGSWTQAYHYFGIEQFLIMTIDDPAQVQRILDRLVPVTVAFANAQLEAGADCLLLADHATSDLCSPAAYEQFLLPLHQRLADEIDAPLILHICGDTRDRIGMIARTGLDCFHWDTKTGGPVTVRSLAGDAIALMGGVGNMPLLRATPEAITAQANEALSAGIDVIGPECAIPLTTPLANLLAITPRRD